MTLRQVLAGLRRRKTLRSRSPSRPLSLEALEDRVVPSTWAHGVLYRDSDAPPPGCSIAYHGSATDPAVLTQAQLQLVFWGSWWDNQTAFENTIVTAVQSIISGPYMGALEQYSGIQPATLLGPAVTNDTTVVPSPTFKGTDLQAMLQGLLNPSSGPKMPSSHDNAKILYIIFTPLGVSDADNANYGGYHTALADGSPYYRTPYAWVKVPTLPPLPGLPSIPNMDQVTQLFSHELVESVTDTDGNGWYFNATSASKQLQNFWGGQEIGDVAQWSYLPGTLNGYRLNNYLVEPYWSEFDRANIVPTIVPTANNRLGSSQDFVFSNGVLTVNGDQQPNKDDSILLTRNGANLDVTLNSDTIEVPFTFFQGIHVNGGAGNNVLTLDFSAGQVIPAGGGLNYDGGNAGQDQLTLAGSLLADTYQPGLNPGAGTITVTTVGDDLTGTLTFENLDEPILDIATGPLTVNGTPADNAINITNLPGSLGNSSVPAGNGGNNESSSSTVAPGAGNDSLPSSGGGGITGAVAIRPAVLGLVTVDNFMPIVFANKGTLNIASGPGIDVINVNLPHTPTGLSNINIDGGDPIIDNRLIVNGVSAAAPVTIDANLSTINGAAGDNGAVMIYYTNIRWLSVTMGDATALEITDSNDYTYTPAPVADAGTVLVPYTPTQIPCDPTLRIDFTQLTTSDQLTLKADGTGTTVVNGTAADDNFVVLNTGAVTLTTGNVTPHTRATIMPTGMKELDLNGLGGADTFNVEGAPPYQAVNLNGNGLADGSTAFISGDGSAVTATVADGSISASYAAAPGVSVTARTGIVNLDSGAGNLTVNDMVRALATVTPTMDDSRSGTFQAGGTAPRLDFATDKSFTANLTYADKKLLVNAPESGDVIDVDGGGVMITAPGGSSYKTINYTGVTALTVNGQDGGDTFNVTPDPAVAFSLDGGDPVGAMPGSNLAIGAGSNPTQFYGGPTSDTGSMVVSGDRPIAFRGMQSFTVTGNPKAGVVINGTNGNDVITVQAADGTTNPGSMADGVQDFTVSVNSGPDFLFIDTPVVTVNTRSGNDQVIVEEPAPNGADWNVNLTINGGLRSGNASVLVEPTGTATYTPSAAHGGLLTLIGATANSTIVLTNVSQLTYDGGGSGLLNIQPNAGHATVTVTPGAADDAGVVSVDRLLPIAFQNLGPGSLLDDHIVITDNTGTDTLLIKGAPGDNTFDLLFVTTVAFVTVNTRVPVAAFGPAVVKLVGGTGNNTLMGPNTATTWNIIGTNSGNLGGGPINFSGVQNLVGGTGGNTFVFSDGKGVTGSIDGGSGNNTLDYSAYKTDVRVNLQKGTATGVAGGVKNIQNVTGGAGNDLILGGSQSGVLRAGAGNDILVGGAGGNTLYGGSGYDILIGGRGKNTIWAGSNFDLMIAGFTAYDNNETALRSLMAEWSRRDRTYKQRIDDLSTGGGLNGRNKLQLGKTVFGGIGGTVLNGIATNNGPNGVLDWFGATLEGTNPDVINNRNPFERVNG
jgi:hypothetical protein